MHTHTCGVGGGVYAAQYTPVLSTCSSTCMPSYQYQQHRHTNNTGPHPLPGPVLYVSGEESVAQVADRATRLSADAPTPPDLMLLSATSMDSILQQAAALRPRAMVVDSIQTVFLGGVGGSAGSVQQVRECSAALLRLAKELGCPVFVVGHVTKVWGWRQGSLARQNPHTCDLTTTTPDGRHCRPTPARAHCGRGALPTRGPPVGAAPAAWHEKPLRPH